MLYHTQGIVFHTTKFSETSLIAKIYTDAFGLQSYMVNGVRKSKSKVSAALLQPLTLLDLVVYHREQKNIQRIKDIKPALTFTQIPFNISKSSLALFTAELLHKTIKERTADKEQFVFLFEAIKSLDQLASGIANWHLWFLLALSRYLGSFPNNNFSLEKQQIFFDLKEGYFVVQQPSHSYYLSPPTSQLLSALLPLSKTEILHFPLRQNQRQQLLQTLVKYYEFHVEGFKPLKSLRVLQTVLG
ncbi:MAG: DNA repair protein RecO [Chitinophagales bacterium]